jgi:hypothetical protein
VRKLSKVLDIISHNVEKNLNVSGNINYIINYRAVDNKAHKLHY